MQTDPDCVFCKIVAGDLPCFKLLEDDLTLAFADINPTNEGHALAIAKEHWPDIHVIPPEILAAVSHSAKKIAAAVDKVFSPDGINIVQANGEGAGQSVFHFHIHILPRRIGDDLALNWGIEPGDVKAVEEAAERIRKQL